MSDLLADAVAELYEADPDEFTGRRAELAAAARDAGEPAAAKQITALRKPTRSAWVVNRLVRSDPEVRDRLDALAADLRAAAGSADGARIRELTAARARLVDELTRQALQVSELPAPPAALREEVTATLDAALADPQVAANLGTLVRAAHWAGFGLAALPAAPAPPRPGQEDQDPAPAEPETEREDRRREKIMAAERTLAQADQDVEAAAAAESDLEQAVRHLEAELADARQRLAEARRTVVPGRLQAAASGRATRSAPGVNLPGRLVPLIQVRPLSRDPIPLRCPLAGRPTGRSLRLWRVLRCWLRWRCCPWTVVRLNRMGSVISSRRGPARCCDRAGC